MCCCFLYFYVNETATTESYTYGHPLSLHDALPIDRAPPRVLDVAEQEHADGAVVVGGPEPAVDLGRREDEPPPLAQVDHLVEQLGLGRGFGHRGGSLPAVLRGPRSRCRGPSQGVW